MARDPQKSPGREKRPTQYEKHPRDNNQAHVEHTDIHTQERIRVYTAHTLAHAHTPPL